ncbi:DUF805 domain-containing protein [Streptomyces turgidiscabies]|uniref:Inner membrane family protein n=1 Tax=Streptomyces turgidiscabies (strain Car8) TaxID=698760 RepID=L7FIU2_STRT8|nr:MULTISPECIES: DUF805 domain-containing protein [Streptomyces]ELP71252.1 inner membrane family protein [Streptomyces turgidiscabies Car8]MDX3498782.1 DUF805 domain-containing protein [Streptomyces turgidiscabies]GAQ74790.1 inner membrane protein YhaH [Streptomyces turgidiscabies]
MNYFLDVLKKYAVFSGRSRRKEYWMFALFSIIISIVLAIIDNAMGSQILGIVYTLAVFLPGLGVTVRRLHDTNRSGWWVLIALVPLVGAITLIVFTCLDGDQGENKYGPNPKFGPAHV